MKIKKDKILKILLMIYTFVVIYTPNFSTNAYINYILPFIFLYHFCLCAFLVSEP